MSNGVLLILVGVLLLLILAGGAWTYRWHLDRVEDWNPWADTVTLQVLTPRAPAVPARLPGRHRLELLTHPFRLPGWD